MTDQISPLHKGPQEFLGEAEDIVDRLAADLSDLADQIGGDEPDQLKLNAVFRGAHSIKGLAGIFGFGGIAELAHQMESLLDRLRLGRMGLTKQVMWLLFESQALLTALLRDIAETGQPAHTDEISACTARIDAQLLTAGEETAAPRLDRLDLPERVVSSLTDYERHRLRDALRKGRVIYRIRASYDLASFGDDLTSLTRTLNGSGEVISTLPGTDDSASLIAFDILFASGQRQDAIRALVDERRVRVEPLKRDTTPRDEPPPLPAVPPAGRGDAGAAERERPVPSRAPSPRGGSHSVRVDIGKLDELMHIVGELTLTQAAIGGIAFRLRADDFSPLVVDLLRHSQLLERRLGALRRGVADIRLIPLSQLFERLSLIVRSVSRQQEKKVRLGLHGGATQIDKRIMEQISDPMMHLIRNAVDHGVELPAERVARGKDESGVIAIRASQKGNHVVIEIEDDGNGIDLEKIRKTALGSGLIPDPADLSDGEALELIFRPGFSTADRVSDLSGRGVGMDVVRSNLAAISGTVEVESVRGLGTRFRITLPVTLAVIGALIVSCAGRTYAVPLSSVHESLPLDADRIVSRERGEFLRLRDETLPLLHLEHFFNIRRRGERPREQYVLVAGIGHACLGVVVDDLLGQQDVVVKSLGPAFSGVPGISGAADLGELGTILVLDVASMTGEALRDGA